MTSRAWLGDNPFFLVISPDRDPARQVIIDLNESLWATKYADLMRVPGEWLLVLKGRTVGEQVTDDRVVLALVVHEGEQPYYTRRHIGSLTFGGEIVAHGLGKKRLDGHVDRLWVLPNGVICGGDDESVIGVDMVRNMAIASS